VDEQKVARPSLARIEKKKILLEELHSSPHLANLLSEATEIYGLFLSRSKDFSAKTRSIARLNSVTSPKSQKTTV
jgi:hypothetical protein